MYTFNKSHLDFINIGNFKYGWTQNIEIKIGRKLYLMDVKKDCSSCWIEVYRKLNKDRKKYSKYDPRAKATCIRVENNAVLDYRFFENIHEIERVQNTYFNYKDILKF